MSDRRRKADTIIDRLEEKVDKILEIMNGNGRIGLVAQAEINKEKIDCLEKRPSSIRGWVVAVTVIIANIIMTLFTRGKI